MAKDSLAQRLDSLLNDADTKYPQEKIYIQYDKAYYNPGETIWFKAYISPTNFPFTISRTAYAELINEKGAILERKVMPVIERGASGDFQVPDSFKNGSLYVRAYTAWMLNFDSSLTYLKQIKVIAKNAVKTVKQAETYTLNLFPEGGDLVASIPCRLAFKATNHEGEPINVNGNIVDSKAGKITTFTSSHDGMGYFSLTPVTGESYKAVWKDKKGLVHETALPAVKTLGVGLMVNLSGSTLNYSLERPSDAGDEFKFFYVIAKMQQQLLYSAKINLSIKTKISAPIPVDSVADGVMQITVFNATQTPVAERLVFINHGTAQFITDLHAPVLDMTKRKRNVLQVDIGDTTFSNLSISVTDEALAAPGTNRESIFSQLLLSSDLKGNVFNAAQYFLSDEDSVRKQLDLVMMTNGWRRIKWESILAGTMPAITHRPENNLTISGTVYGPSKMLLKGKEISGILKTKSGGSEFFVMPVEQDGTFKIDNVVLFDTAKLYYQFNADKDKRLTSSSSFNFNSAYTRAPQVFAGLFKGLPPSARPDSVTEHKNIVFTDRMKQQFYEGNNVKELTTVVVKTKTKTLEQRMNDDYTSGFFNGGDAQTFILSTDPSASGSLSVLDYLRSKVAGMQVSTAGTASVTWRGSATSIFLNESPSDVETVQSISMNDVAMIKVFRPPFFGASGGGAGGAVAVYLKKGEDATKNVKGLDFTNISGFSSIKEFYSPDYEKITDNTSTDDLRSTLYWNPFLFFDRDSRRVTIRFFNTDNCKKIRVIIEGINRLGQFTHEEKVFQ